MKVSEYSFLNQDHNSSIEVGFLSISEVQIILKVFLAFKYKNYKYQVFMDIEETEKLISDLTSVITLAKKDIKRKKENK